MENFVLQRLQPVKLRFYMDHSVLEWNISEVAVQIKIHAKLIVSACVIAMSSPWQKKYAMSELT